MNIEQIQPADAPCSVVSDPVYYDNGGWWWQDDLTGEVWGPYGYRVDAYYELARVCDQREQERQAVQGIRA